jgi:hypothetical protein
MRLDRITGPSIARASSAVVLDVASTAGARFDPESLHATSATNKAMAAVLMWADCPQCRIRCKNVCSVSILQLG